MADTLIASIEKNAREEIRVSLSEFNGHDLANLRIWFDAGDGDMRPGNKGLAFKLDKLEAEARRLGLVE